MKALSDAKRSIWNSPEKLRKAINVIDCLERGDIECAMKMLDKVDGRWDLRGFDFSLHEGEKPFMHYWPDGMVGSKRGVEYHDITLEGFDFTNAIFAMTKWIDCEFCDCLFKEAVLRSSDFQGCTFRRVRFEDCSHGGLLGGFTRKNLGRFEDVEFVSGNLLGADFWCPAFERCHFHCGLTRVYFNGSQFNDCSFQGILNEVWFHGISRKNSDPKWWATLDIPPNPMRGIDFSQATFKEVYFCDGIDLSDCKFPTKGGVLYLKDGTEVFSEVARRIEAEWEEPDRRVGISEARYMLQEDCHPRGQVVYSPQMMKKRIGNDLALKFTAVVEQVVREQGHDS
jgi:uncharacterized protein YjbI with pentapeptide repeats